MFFTKYERLCRIVGKTPTGVGRELDIPKTTISSWKRGKGNIPRQDMLIKIANYFDVSIDELLGNDKPNRDDEVNEYVEFLKYRPEGKRLFSIAKECTKQEIEQAIKIIGVLRKNDE